MRKLAISSSVACIVLQAFMMGFYISDKNYSAAAETFVTILWIAVYLYTSISFRRIIESQDKLIDNLFSTIERIMKERK